MRAMVRTWRFSRVPWCSLPYRTPTPESTVSQLVNRHLPGTGGGRRGEERTCGVVCRPERVREAWHGGGLRSAVCGLSTVRELIDGWVRGVFVPEPRGSARGSGNRIRGWARVSVAMRRLGQGDDTRRDYFVPSRSAAAGVGCAWKGISCRRRTGRISVSRGGWGGRPAKDFDRGTRASGGGSDASPLSIQKGPVGRAGVSVCMWAGGVEREVKPCSALERATVRQAVFCKLDTGARGSTRTRRSLSLHRDETKPPPRGWGDWTP